MRKYTATVTFTSGNSIYYPEFLAKSKVAAKLKVQLDRQNKGDEMFIRSIKIEVVKPQEKI